MGARRVVDILMTRDGISEEEAKQRVKDFRLSAKEAIENGDFDDVEELLQDDLGLEPDYLFDLIY